jgi:hypothetical protein
VPRITGDSHYVVTEVSLGPNGEAVYEAVCTMPGCGFAKRLRSGTEGEYRRVAASHEREAASAAESD